MRNNRDFEYTFVKFYAFLYVMLWVQCVIYMAQRWDSLD